MDLIRTAIKKLSEKNITTIDMYAVRIKKIIVLNENYPLMTKNDELSYIAMKNFLRGYLNCLVDAGILTLEEYLEIYFYVKAGRKLEDVK